MTANRLPRLATDAWSGGFVMDRATDVQTVDCCQGVVLAATRQSLYLMRAGEHRLSTRERPPEVGPVRAVDAIVALAGDGRGTLAAASIDGDEPGVWVSRDGEQWHRRELRELDGMGGWPSRATSRTSRRSRGTRCAACSGAPCPARA